MAPQVDRAAKACRNASTIISLMALLAIGPAPWAEATVVRFNFTVGGADYGSADIRLFDNAMPNSVANFLGYFDRYAGTFIHRNPRDQSTPGMDGLGGPDGDFVVQGGGFEFTPPNGAPPVVTDPPILDEPGGGVQGISNLRGTLSNAKSGPDTVTSQWFVNLDDNSFLDDPNRPDGGFAAFGRVLGDGMDVFDDIDLLEKRDLDPSSPLARTFNDVPVGDFNDPLGTLVILESVEVLDNPLGDYNFDGVVDASDYSVWRDSLGSTVNVEADGNGDGVVNQPDYNIWKATFGVTAATSVPEPTAAALFALGAAALIALRQ